MEKFSMEFTVEEWRMLLAAAVQDRSTPFPRLRSIAKRIAAQTALYDSRGRATVLVDIPSPPHRNYRPFVYAGAVVALVLVALIGVSVM